jgi:hypothetical protein
MGPTAYTKHALSCVKLEAKIYLRDDRTNALGVP